MPLPYRILIYILVLLAGVPLLLAVRMARLAPESGSPRPDQAANPFPFEARLRAFVTADGVTIRAWHATRGRGAAVRFRHS